MTLKNVLMTALLLSASSALAAEPTLPAQANDKAREALAKQATAPTERPVLPDAASDRAVEVHKTIAFGAKGAAMRAAHSQATKATTTAHGASTPANATGAAHANASATTAVSTAGSAGQARADEAQTATHGSSAGHRP
jgi:hypothetical protein